MKKLFLMACLLVLAHSGYSQTNEKLLRNYYRAYEQKNWNLLKSILSPGFHFSSPVDQPPIDLETYHRRCWPNSKNTKRFDLEKVIMGNDDAFVTYNGHTNDGRVFRNTEYFKFKDGRITENDCYFGPGVNFPNSGKK
ncbi:nuclear transport factor 2 family protein [Mucilaginibacter sp. PPCGB 2223]|uniref:nuclear transport factor 2 family protein n=1 Tax=Mucilaginibacter sp. PPCGB 2223 TaxID=1886027 RepID=UPI0009F322BD|nr:nuclear transport factor 2 family protein [Mucilaginibacter sp. PPCGB 2223]